MNCTRFRYLIQKNFDTDLTKQDENALLKHLDSCDSCGKFNHQIQQVIIGTNDLNLPKSILPQSPEAICKKIIQDLPKPKSNLVVLIESIIAKFKKAPESKKLTSHSQEPHEQVLTKPKNSKEKTQEIEEDHLAQTSRLRSLGKAVSDLAVESRESQSTTKSLGQKLKINTGNALTQEERPLTAAELIRLKVAENQKNAHEAENPITEEPKKTFKLDNGNYVNQNVSTNPIDMANSSNQPIYKSTGNSQSEDQMIVEPILGGWGNTAPMPPKPALWEDEEANAQIDSDALTSWNSPQTESKTITQDTVSKEIASKATGWETQSSEWLATNSFESNVTQEPVHSTNQSGWSSPNLVSNQNVKQPNNDIKNIWGDNVQPDTNKSSNKVSDSQSVAAWGAPIPNPAVSDSQAVAVWGAATSPSPISNPVAAVQPNNDSVLPAQDVAVWENPQPVAQANSVPPSQASNEPAFGSQLGVSAWGNPQPVAPANIVSPSQASNEPAFGSQPGVSAWGNPQPVAPANIVSPSQASNEPAFGSQSGVSGWGAPQPVAPANIVSPSQASNEPAFGSQPGVSAWGNPQPVAPANIVSPSQASNEPAFGSQSGVSAWGAPQTVAPANIVSPSQASNEPAFGSQSGVSAWGAPQPVAPANIVSPSQASNEPAFGSQPGVSAWGAPQTVAPANIVSPSQASNETAFGSQSGVSAWGAPQTVAPANIVSPSQASNETAFGSQSGVSAWGAPQPVAPANSVSPSQPETAFGSQSGVSAWGEPQPVAPANIVSPSQPETAFGSQSGVSAWGAPQPVAPANSVSPSQPETAFGSQPGVSAWGAPQPVAPANIVSPSPEFNNDFNPGNFATNSNDSSVDFNKPWTNTNNFPQENIANNDIFDTNNKPTEPSSFKKPVLNRRNIVIPEEQISTGNWKAFTPNQNALGAINKTTQRVSQTNPALKGENPFENEKNNNQAPFNQPIQTTNPLANNQPVNNQTPFNQPIQTTNPLANSQPVNNQTPFNQPIQTTNPLANSQPVNNQAPFNQPIQTTNPLANSQPVNNQTPFNQPIQTTNPLANSQPVNNQTPFNQPIQTTNPLANNQPVNNQTPFNQPIQTTNPLANSQPVNDQPPLNQPIQNNNTITSSPGDNSSSGLLGQISDSDMDKIFSENLGLKENSSFTKAPVQNNFSNPIPPMSPINQIENKPGSNITKLNSPKPGSNPNNNSDSAQSGLFNLNDDDIDKIFSENLGFKENSNFSSNQVQNNFSNPIAPMPPINLPEHKPEPSINTLNSSIPEVNFNNTPATSPTGLFNLNDDDMDKLFAVNLGINTELKPILPQSNPAQSTNQQQSNPNQPVFEQQQSNPNQPVFEQQQSNPNQPVFEQQRSNPNQPVFEQQQSNPNQPVFEQQRSNPNQPVFEQQQPNPENKRISTSPQASQTNLFSFNQQMINNLYTNENSDNSVANQQTENNIASPQLTPVNLNPMNYPTPKIYGIGRLDTKNEVSSETGSGRISNIGNFLLDQKDKEGLKNLMNNNINELNTRILTEDTSNNLKKMLEHIQTQTQVIGSVLVGMDGFLYSNTLPREIDAESFGVWALGIFMNTSNVVKQLQFNKVKHIISKTQLGYLIIADCKDVILVTVSNGNDTSTLMPLMKTITNLLPK